MSKPAFDPNKPYQAVSKKPAFDPAKPYEAMDDAAFAEEMAGVNDPIAAIRDRKVGEDILGAMDIAGAISRSGVKSGIEGGNPLAAMGDRTSKIFSKDYPAGVFSAPTGGDILGSLGMEPAAEDAAWYEKFGKGAAGLGVELVTDPTNILTASKMPFKGTIGKKLGQASESYAAKSLAQLGPGAESLAKQGINREAVVAAAKQLAADELMPLITKPQELYKKINGGSLLEKVIPQGLENVPGAAAYKRGAKQKGLINELADDLDDKIGKLEKQDPELSFIPVKEFTQPFLLKQVMPLIDMTSAKYGLSMDEIQETLGTIVKEYEIVWGKGPQSRTLNIPGNTVQTRRYGDNALGTREVTEQGGTRQFRSRETVPQMQEGSVPGQSRTVTENVEPYTTVDPVTGQVYKEGGKVSGPTENFPGRNFSQEVRDPITGQLMTEEKVTDSFSKYSGGKSTSLDIDPVTGQPKQVSTFEDFFNARSPRKVTETAVDPATGAPLLQDERLAIPAGMSLQKIHRLRQNINKQVAATSFWAGADKKMAARTEMMTDLSRFLGDYIEGKLKGKSTDFKGKNIPAEDYYRRMNAAQETYINLETLIENTPMKDLKSPGFTQMAVNALGAAVPGAVIGGAFGSPAVGALATGTAGLTMTASKNINPLMAKGLGAVSKFVQAPGMEIPIRAGMMQMRPEVDRDNYVMSNREPQAMQPAIPRKAYDYTKVKALNSAKLLPDTGFLLNNKEFLLRKVAHHRGQQEADDFAAMLEMTTEPEALKKMLANFAYKNPGMFQFDNRNRFDGIIQKDVDKAKAIRDIMNSKMGSREKARAIEAIKKNQEGISWPK